MPSGAVHAVVTAFMLLVPALAYSQDSSKVVQLLQSADPREQAWGAWYAGRDMQPELVPYLEQVVLHRLGSESVADSAALDIALDALIQLRTPVPSDLLVAVHARRPAQALALL